jgi:hypothetical protein
VRERPNPYRGHRFPREVIAHAVRLYRRFALSFRDVEEPLVERGIVVSYETVRRWVAKFGSQYADGLRRRESRPGRTWHLDEMATRVGGRPHWLWRAVDEHGQTLDVLLQERRDTRRRRAVLPAPPGCHERCAAGADHDRQAGELRRGDYAAARDGVGRARAGPVGGAVQQSRRAGAPTHSRP